MGLGAEDNDLWAKTRDSRRRRRQSTQGFLRGATPLQTLKNRPHLITRAPSQQSSWWRMGKLLIVTYELHVYADRGNASGRRGMGDAQVLHVASDSDRSTSQHHKTRKHIRVFSAPPFLLTVLCAVYCIARGKSGKQQRQHKGIKAVTSTAALNRSTPRDSTEPKTFESRLTAAWERAIKVI